MPRKTPKPKWRNLPDDIILRLTPTTTGSNESLCPTESTVLRSIAGDPTARAAIASYGSAILPVTIVEVLECA